MNRDLTTGKASSVLWRFCLPLLASVIFQQLYNIADSVVAGKYIGENALAAVGNSYEITMIFIAFAFGCNMGCSVVSAKKFGAKAYKELKTAVYTTFISTAVLCCVLMLFGLVFSSSLLSAINTPQEVFDDSQIYLHIYIYGVPFMFFYNISMGVFSALGDSKTPFIFLACSSVANIIVDIIFVKAFQMGVSGVAWATFLCQGVSCIPAMIFILIRLHNIPTTGKIKPFSFDVLKQILIVAIPSVLQQSFISVGNIIIQGIINSFSTATMAGYSAAIKLNNLVITSVTALGNGVSNFTAQNIGAGKIHRIREGFFAALKLVSVIILPITLLYFFFGKYFVYAFLDNPSAQAMNTGAQILRILSVFYIVVSAKLISDGILKGVGMMNKFMIATFTDLLLRVALAKLLSHYLGSVGIWLAWPIGWSVATIMSLLFYKNSKYYSNNKSNTKQSDK